MKHNQTVTQLRRQNRYATSDFALLSLVREDFSGEGGAAELAKVLGVSLSEASGIRAGKAPPNMDRLAYHYGFRPDDAASGWRVLPMDVEPFDAGPPLRWDARLIEYLRLILSNPAGGPSVRELAWRLDTTESRLRDALRRSGIHLLEGSEARRRGARGDGGVAVNRQQQRGGVVEGMAVQAVTGA